MFKKYRIYISTTGELDGVRVAEVLTYMNVKFIREDGPANNSSTFFMKVTDSQLEFMSLNRTLCLTTCTMGLILKSGRSLSFEW